VSGAWLSIPLAAGAGALLAVAWLGALWWTVARLPRQKRPALWAAAGFGLRLILVAGGFCLIAAGDWRRLAACGVGFVLARMVALRRMRAGIGRAKGWRA
jgi:F1F0 ATPase subunit 2